MPHTDVIPTSASIASTGLSIRYIGNHAYAYSGSHQATAAGHTTMLDFTSQSGYLIAKIAFGNTSVSSDHIEFEINLNGETVMAAIADAIGESFPLNDFRMLIPPNTHVEITTINASGGGDRTVFVSLSGRVYGAE